MRDIKTKERFEALRGWASRFENSWWAIGEKGALINGERDLAEQIDHL